MSPLASTLVSSIGFAFALSIATPAARTLYQKSVKRNEAYDADDLYEDNDGVATEKSQADFSTLLARSICLGASLSAFLLSIATAVINTAGPDRVLRMESWLTFGEWVESRPYHDYEASALI